MSWGTWLRAAVMVLAVLISAAGRPAAGEETSPGQDGDLQASSAQRGYRLLLDTPYLPPDFDQKTFDAAWQVWPEPLRGQAEKASPEERREMAFERYGLTARPDDPAKPLQYVVGEDGQWTMNCFACHQGKVGGQIIPGVANAHFALETLTADMRATKLQLGRPLSRMDIGSLFMPLGGSNGTTNAVMFGAVLMSYRDAELNVVRQRSQPEMTHHDHDAPAWWHLSRKKRLYIDGFAPKSHRALMQFLLVKVNGPEKFRRWEDDFRHILDYIESIEPPRYEGPVDSQLAEKGAALFNRNCATCHGTYGPDGEYPEMMVPLEIVGTDAVRHRALKKEHREHYGRSWFAQFGKQPIIAEPSGYVAPPLDGVWASAPYLHNGSVPTLWHLLHPRERPAVWLKRENGYDHKRVGLAVETFDRVPDEVTRADERRRYFDTRRKGKSAGGHGFPDKLTEDEKAAVLEYLKTL